MADKSVWFETVKHYINVLVGMIVIFGVVTGLYFGWYQSRSGKMIWVSNSYHLATSLHCSSAKEQYMKIINSIEKELNSSKLTENKIDASEASLAYQLAVKDISMIVLLQTIHHDDKYTDKTDLVRDQFNSIVIKNNLPREQAKEISKNAYEYIKVLDSLQAEHQNDNVILEAKIKTWRKRRTYHFLGFLVLILIIGFGLVRRITSLIKMILFRLLEESDERESERKVLKKREEEIEELRSIIYRVKQEHPEIEL